MRSLRRMLSPQEQDVAAKKLFAQMQAFDPYRQARMTMAYMACRGEISLAPAIADMLESGRTPVLPRCEAPGLMTARRIRAVNDLMPGAYGLLEPGERCEIVRPEEIDLILVPGTAFDREGHRLGQGGGYYDRFLKESRALRAGVCHEFALLDSVPFEAHDEIMDYIITPCGIIRTGRKQTGGCGHG